MRAQRLVVARLGVPTMLVGLLGAIGLVAATPAFAAVTATINSPANNASYTGYQKLAVDGTVNYGSSDSGTATLSATDPDYTSDSSTGCVFTVGSSSYGGPAGGTYSADVAGPLDLSAAYPKSCATSLQGKPAVNGTWKLSLATSSGTTVTSSFKTAVAPAAPTGVKASSGSPLAVTVTWTPNAEPDTHAYAVLDGSGAVISGPTDAAGTCSSSSCSAAFIVSQSGSQSFSVRAYRYVAPPTKATASATADDLTADSAAQTVNVQAKPAPSSASPTPSASASSGGGATPPPVTKSSAPAAGASSSPTAAGSASAAAPGQSTSPTPTTATSAHAATPLGSGKPAMPSGGAPLPLNNNASAGEAAKIGATFKDFAPPTGIDKLPPLPKLSAITGGVANLTPAVATDDGEPTDDGTFKPTLGYAPQTKTVVTHTVTAGAPLSFVADAIGISPDALWRSLAGSLLLILCAGHVRRWARQPIE